MSRHLLTILMLTLTASSLHADDRDLLLSNPTPPNVLIILDSASGMVHDFPSGSIGFPACGDDTGIFSSSMVDHYGAGTLEDLLGKEYLSELKRGSKLMQAKHALQDFLDLGIQANYAFSFFEKTQLSIKQLHFIYRVKEVIDTTGNGVEDTPQSAMLSGISPGTPLRFGGNPHPGTRPLYPLRYGRRGTGVFVEKCNPLGRNSGYETTSDIPVEGDIRLISLLVKPRPSGNPIPLAQLSNSERSAAHLWYYPAYSLPDSGPSYWIKLGYQASISWEDVASHLGIDTAQSNWRRILKNRVESELRQHQIGSKTLSIEEYYQVYRNGEWTRAIHRPNRITQVEFVQPFVLYEQAAAGLLSAIGFPDDADCRGYYDLGAGKEPLLPFSIPDPSDGSIGDNRRDFRSFLGPQWAPVRYFPEDSPPFLPRNRESYLPLTETVTAAGSRPLGETVSEAAHYFSHELSRWDDPLAQCRKNLLVLITDGEGNCPMGRGACGAATDFPGEIHVISLSGDDSRDLICAAETTGGSFSKAADRDQILAELVSIFRKTDAVTSGFSPLLTPSVDPSAPQISYIPSFTPFARRSIWQGHLRAYSVDPATGLIAGLGVKGKPKTEKALWDAGDVLAQRWDWGDVLITNPLGQSMDPRRIYYGSPGMSSRGVFAYPGDEDTEFENRARLGRAVFGAWAPTPSTEIAERQRELHNVIDFIRGVRFALDNEGNQIGLRDIRRDHQGVEIPSSSYHWCGATGDDEASGSCTPGQVVSGIEKLGDIFHSTPRKMAAPACTACLESDYRDYDDFYQRHRHRRAVLFAGSNDGLMHAFDAGIWISGGSTGQKSHYDGGSGRELFAWAPGAVMETFPGLKNGIEQQWSVDGSPVIADVFVDRHFVDQPRPEEREWRTMLLWGERRGGRSYTALDITQPDRDDSRSDNMAFDPRACYDIDTRKGEKLPISTERATKAGYRSPDSSREVGCDLGGPECSGVWPEFCWEFTDTSDEDSNGSPDLGLTFSSPLVGFVRVQGPKGPEDRMVMFAGGGYSPRGIHAGHAELSGNFIYGIDIETGEILLKHRVEGMVPGDLQGLDLNLDGFLERVYFGTTAGNIYRIDFSEAAELDPRGRARNWAPEKIFDAEGYQPFFMRPTLVPVTFDSEGTPGLAIAIGAGNRDDIFEKNLMPHRFYVFMDPADSDSCLSDSDLEQISIDSDNVDGGTNYLLSPTSRGWYLEFSGTRLKRSYEKVGTPALALRSLISFTNFGPALNPDPSCRPDMRVRSYLLDLFNANAVSTTGKRWEDFDKESSMAGEAVVYLGSDGRIHILQAMNNLVIRQPVASFEASVRMVDWKEKTE